MRVGAVLIIISSGQRSRIAKIWKFWRYDQVIFNLSDQLPLTKQQNESTGAESFQAIAEEFAVETSVQEEKS
jgi:hypothetical protein